MRSRIVPALVFAAVVAAMAWAAVSGDVYEATSPSEFPHHVIIRKLWSIAAFTLVGLVIPQSGRPAARIVRGAAIVSLFSAAIEIAQRLTGSTESLAWNLFDVGCGTAGGILGSALALLFRHRSPRS